MPDAIPPPASGRSSTPLHGTKREAQIKLAELITAVGQGRLRRAAQVDCRRIRAGRVDQWEAAGDISARTAQRYRQLVENQIAPHIGAKLLQKLTRLDIEGWHTTLAHRADWQPAPSATRTACCARRLTRRRTRRLDRQERLQAPEGAQGRRQRNGHRAGRARPCGQAARLRASLRPRHGGAVHRHAARRGAGAALEPRRS